MSKFHREHSKWFTWPKRHCDSSSGLTFVSRQIDIVYIRQTHHKYSAKINQMLRWVNWNMGYRGLTCWGNCGDDGSWKSIRHSSHAAPVPIQWSRRPSYTNHSQPRAPWSPCIRIQLSRPLHWRNRNRKFICINFNWEAMREIHTDGGQFEGFL